MVLRFLVFGKPNVAGMGKWESHFLALIGLLLAKAVADGMESLSRLMAIRGADVPGLIDAASSASDLLFWPAAFLALHLLVAIIHINILEPKRGAAVDG